MSLAFEHIRVGFSSAVFIFLLASDSHLLTLCHCWFIWITVINIIVFHFLYLYHSHIHTQYIGISVEFGGITIWLLFSVWSEKSLPVCLFAGSFTRSHALNRPRFILSRFISTLDTFSIHRQKHSEVEDEVVVAATVAAATI